jgi:hypothetical protein
MNRHAIRVAGILFLATAGSVAAQTGTPATTGGPHAAIPKSNKSFFPSGGVKTGTTGLNLTAPIAKAGGTKTGAGSGMTFHLSQTGTGTTTGTGTGMTNPTGLGGTGFGGFGGTGGQSGVPLSSGQQVALLAEARLLVVQLEATGNLPLNRNESMLLTLLVYEALRQQATRPGTGTPSLPTTP